MTPNFEVVLNPSSNSSTISSQVSVGTAPSISHEVDQVRLLSQQLQELQASNTSFQQCIVQLQSQVTQLIYQNNQLVQKMISSSSNPPHQNPHTNQTSMVDLLDNGTYAVDLPTTLRLQTNHLSNRSTILQWKNLPPEYPTQIISSSRADATFQN